MIRKLMCLVFLLLTFGVIPVAATPPDCVTVETMYVENNCVMRNSTTCCEGYCVVVISEVYCSGG